MSDPVLSAALIIGIVVGIGWLAALIAWYFEK